MIPERSAIHVRSLIADFCADSDSTNQRLQISCKIRLNKLEIAETLCSATAVHRDGPLKDFIMDSFRQLRFKPVQQAGRNLIEPDRAKLRSTSLSWATSLSHSSLCSATTLSQRTCISTSTSLHIPVEPEAPEDASDGRRRHGMGHREFDSMTFKPFDIAIYILN